MRLEIPFNETIFRGQMLAFFDFAWNENLEKNKFKLYYALAFIIAGGLLVYFESRIGYLIIITGLHYLIVTFNYYHYYKKSKAKYQLVVNQEINSTIENDIINVWEFNDDYLFHKDYKHEIKVNWSAFKDYVIVEDNLFLTVTNGLTYIINKNEIKETEFALVKTFLKGKVTESIKSKK
jgi:hypothetical protein